MTGDTRHNVPVRCRLQITYLSMPLFSLGLFVNSNSARLALDTCRGGRGGRVK